MREHFRFKLLHGPYHTPHLKPRTEVWCELRGYVKVADYSDGRIPWPRTLKQSGRRRYRRNGRGRAPMILFGDLARAVKLESNMAIQYWWGINGNLVTKWRKALGVPPVNEGSQILYRNWYLSTTTPQSREIVRLAALRPAARQKANRTRAERGLALNARPFSPKEDKMLGMASDRLMAAKIGRSTASVFARRRLLGITAFAVSPDHQKSAMRPLNPAALAAIRKSRGLSMAALARKCGFHPTAISRLESGGVKRVLLATLKTLASALRCRRSRLIFAAQN